MRFKLANIPHLAASVLALSVAIPRPASGAVFTTAFDIIDDKFNQTDAGYSGPGQYDFFNGTDGTLTADGYNDIEVIVATSGTGTVGGVIYAASVDDSTTTGLVSSTSTTNATASNNNGHRMVATIEIRFLSSMTVAASNILDFSFSSGNTAGISWETTYIQYLDTSYSPIGSTPVIQMYLAHTPINGQSGNSFVADGKGTVTNVGGTPTAAGTSGANDASPTTFDTPLELGISGATSIGGIRFVHTVEDVRGTSNSNNSFTASINDLELINFTVIPEPSGALLAVCGLGLILVRRRK